jgi:hypothetical protein
MKVKDLIEQLKYYNQDAGVFLNSNYKHIGFTLAFGGGDGVEKGNCETVSIYPDDLGCESSQTERMYSEEEVIDFLQEMNDWPTTFEGRIDIREWFEQFKKK